MATTSNMFLYSLTIQPPSHVVQAVLGQFGNNKEQLIATAAGSQLTLLRPEAALGKIQTVLTHNVFGIIRSLAACRVTGSAKGEFVPKPSLALIVHIKDPAVLRAYCWSSLLSSICSG